MKTFFKNTIDLTPVVEWEPGCWINVEDPSESDKEYLLKEIRIPETFYNDIEDVDERPRIETENDWTLIILRLPFKSNDEKVPFTTIPFRLAFKNNVFVTICFFKPEVTIDFICLQKRKKENIKNNYDFVFKLLLSSNIWFLKYLKIINQNIKLAEAQLEKSIKNEDLQTLLQIEKSLVFFTTSLRSNDILVHKLKKHKGLLDVDLVEDVEIELRQALETTNVYSDILTSMVDAYSSVISNNLNIIMKQLTTVSIVLMIPTLVASLYGMNVPNSFEKNQFGFWIILTISFLISVFGAIILKKKIVLNK
jgi:magnesium transporter